MWAFSPKLVDCERNGQKIRQRCSCAGSICQCEWKHKEGSDVWPWLLLLISLTVPLSIERADSRSAAGPLAPPPGRLKDLGSNAVCWGISVCTEQCGGVANTNTPQWEPRPPGGPAYHNNHFGMKAFYIYGSVLFRRDALVGPGRRLIKQMVLPQETWKRRKFLQRSTNTSEREKALISLSAPDFLLLNLSCFFSLKEEQVSLHGGPTEMRSICSYIYSGVFGPLWM